MMLSLTTPYTRELWKLKLDEMLLFYQTYSPFMARPEKNPANGGQGNQNAADFFMQQQRR